MKKKISFKWSSNNSKVAETCRVGAMYCFKYCDVNQN